MKYFLLFPLLVLLSIGLSFADLGDDFAKLMFQQKVDELYEKAKTCNPIEKDHKSSTTIEDWIKIQPPLPNWKLLTELESTANEARTYARKIGGNDKKLHCLAGCFIAKKLDYPSAVLVGWLKELADASDCSVNTSFEKRDYEVTITGAKAIHSSLSCENYCKKIR